MFGGGAQPLPAQTVDYGAAIQGLFSGASSLLQNAVLRHVAQQQRDTAERHAQMAEADRQAQLGIAQQREARESQAAQAAAEQRRQAQQNADREFQFKQDQAGKPKAHYDATSGKFVYEDGHAVQAGTPRPPAATHIDPLSPEGIAADVERRRREATIETPAERRAAEATARAAAAAERATTTQRIATARGALDEARRDVPRPSRAAAEAATEANALVLPPKVAAQRIGAARSRATQDSLAYERDVLQPARVNYNAAVGGGAPPTAAAAPAPVAPVAPAPGRLRTPQRVNPAMQAEFDAAAARYRQHLQNPAIPKDRLRDAYSQDLAAIAKKYGAVP